MSFLESFFNLIDNYGIYIVFIVIFLEYSCFPLPSEVLLPLTGAIGYINNINPFVMIALSVASGLLGSVFCYIIGYYGLNKILKRITKRNTKEVIESNSFYDKYKNIAISCGRVIPLVRTYISFVAGTKKHNLIQYLIFTSIGITIWNTILILLGYLFYDNIELISKYYKQYKYILLAIAIPIIIFLILKKIKKTANSLL